MIKNIILISGAAILLVIIAASIYIFTSGPKLPPETDAVIEQVLKSELPELIKGKTGFAYSNGVKIWYESIEPIDTNKGAVLLIMGIANDALAWPDYFIQPLVDSGYQVIRFDNRGTGMSDWMEDWDSDSPYTLEVMAKDGFAVMDELGIQKAHIVGISMGGMIAQEMTIKHPERVLSLTSMMSSGYMEDPYLPGIPADIIKEFVILGIKYTLSSSEENTIKTGVASRLLLMGDTKYDPNVKSIAEYVLYNNRKRKGYNPDASKQQMTAVSTSGSRYEKLKEIEIPILIIHGTSDPMIPIEHGRKCAELIPDAHTLWVEGMGHDIPEIFAGTIIGKIVKNFQRAR
ncbi:alpha/beta fold hydrolase [Bacteroidota bacterium]